MPETKSRFVTKLLWAVVAIVAIVVGAEAIFVVIEEVVDIIVETSQALFMLIFEKGFGMPYEKAQGWAAWTSLGLLVLIVLVTAWKLKPSVKRAIATARQWRREGLSAGVERWRAAKWYEKLLVVAGGLTFLFGLLLVI